MNAISNKSVVLPSLEVDVVERGSSARKGFIPCEIDVNVSFDVSAMESFFFADWNPVLYDAFLVAAAVEFCDRTKKRPAYGWSRNFELHIPVHDPEKWQQSKVSSTLHEALNFLTGDYWSLHFHARKRRAIEPRQKCFNLDRRIIAVIPFSNGLDSCVAARLYARKIGDGLVRVRLGTKDFAPDGITLEREPFTAIPYSVKKGHKGFRESSVRSRGFKFAIASGIAAYLSKAKKIIVPESGQGAFGSSLVPVGHIYTDYRTHPRFSRKMEYFIDSLLNFKVYYDYPHVLETKGETLAHFIKTVKANDVWKDTRSCWQSNRYTGVNHKARQCGICAACMLRRLSVHAARQVESNDTYVWENLSAPTFEKGASSDFDRNKITTRMKQYAIAGTLHLDHLARLLNSTISGTELNIQSYYLSQALKMPRDTVNYRLRQMLAQHKQEWGSFINSLGCQSFVAKWVNRERP